jgi:hypothetical protein
MSHYRPRSRGGAIWWEGRNSDSPLRKIRALDRLPAMLTSILQSVSPMIFDRWPCWVLEWSVLVASAIDPIGGTPLIALDRIYRGPGRIVAKAEFLQPGGSVKDRAARAILLAARNDGRLRPGMPVVEMTRQHGSRLGRSLRCARSPASRYHVRWEQFCPCQDVRRIGRGSRARRTS